MAHRVVVLALPGVVTFDLGCVMQVFGHAPSMIGERGQYDLRVCSEGNRTVPTSDGVWLVVQDGLAAVGEADTVVVPGYVPWQEPPKPAVLRALGAAAGRGARVMSICVGAFALASAGILDGHRATTHWAAASRTFTRHFRAETGISPTQWLQQIRVQRCCELLESNELSVEAVASASGFPTAAAMRAAFGQALSTTPTSYRRRFRTSA